LAIKRLGDWKNLLPENPKGSKPIKARRTMTELMLVKFLGLAFPDI
jgi:hypothetical protein